MSAGELFDMTSVCGDSTPGTFTSLEGLRCEFACCRAPHVSTSSLARGADQRYRVAALHRAGELHRPYDRRRNYGYFRDELYYIDSGRHFQTGYVDFPPFIAWLAGILRIFGDNLVVLHIISALANAALVVVTGLMAREMGGGRVAQRSGGAGHGGGGPSSLATGSLYTMDVFDELWWGLAAYVFIRLVRRQ